MLLATAVVSAGALVTTGGVRPAGQRRTSGSHLFVRQIAFGKKLHHKFRVGGTGAVRTEALAGPDDITELGRDLYVGFQNGVGSQGEPSTTATWTARSSSSRSPAGKSGSGT